MRDKEMGDIGPKERRERERGMGRRKRE